MDFSNIMVDVEDTTRDGMAIKTEATWHTASDSSVKMEDSSQVPDIKCDTFATPIKAENGSGATSGYSLSDSSGYCPAQLHTSVTIDHKVEEVPVTRPDSSDIPHILIDRNVHRCSICQKIFSLGHNHKQHMVIHTGAKPYECDICQKTFARNSELKTHTFSHTG